jgi:hypothetical protein
MGISFALQDRLGTGIYKCFYRCISLSKFTIATTRHRAYITLLDSQLLSIVQRISTIFTRRYNGFGFQYSF